MKFKIFLMILFFFMQNNYAQKTIERKDKYTYENTTFIETKTFSDGKIMSKEKVDGVIYIAENNIFYKRIILGAINVKWFGAKGDGDANDNGTDDTESITFALKTLGKIYKVYDITGNNLFGGFTLFFPNGKYLVNRTFILPNNTTIIGESLNSTMIHMIKPKFIFTNIAGFYDNKIDVIMNHNVNIKNITLKQGGIEFQQAVGSRIEDVRIMNLFGNGTDTGVSIKLSVDLKVKNLKIFGSTGYGVLFQENVGGRASTTTSFDNLWVSHCKIGMLVDGSDGNYGIVSSNIINSIFEYNKVGIQFKGKISNFALRDMHFEQNSINAIEMESNANIVFENIWGDNVGAMKILENKKSNGMNKIFLKNFNIPYKLQGNFSGKIIVEQ